ncbi:MAG TPA: hypothetical protein VJQ47_06695 [Steroidobacteraceae bacterium]|nr:hypothetical protein [Steroidobacteraceae bacterium]
MTTACGVSAPGAQWPALRASGSDTVSAINGQIRQDQAQLNDWTTCVSARTTKGQAEIQKLSGQISADKEKIIKALETQAAASSAASIGPVAGPQTSTQHALLTSQPSRPGALDVWA